MKGWVRQAIAAIEADFLRSSDTHLSDAGERYLDTYYSDDWLKDNGFDMAQYRKNLEEFYEKGTMPDSKS